MMNTDLYRWVEPTDDGCLLCPAQGRGLCRHMPSLVRHTLTQGLRSVANGRDVFSQGEPCSDVFVLIDGWAFLYELLEDGRRQILQFALPGDLLGFPVPVDAAPYGAQSLGDARVCVMPCARLNEAVLRDPTVGMRLAMVTSCDEAAAYAHLTTLGRRTARERVAAFLVEVGWRARRQLAANGTIPLPLTQTHIGDALGLTPIHISRMLGALRSEGVIDYRPGRLRILDAEKLCAIARVDGSRSLLGREAGPS